MVAKRKYAVEAKDIHKSFGKLKVLEGVNFQVPKGTITAMLGPNGAGKTTTVRILSTLLKADKGQALIDSHDVANESDAVRSKIGLTGQYAAVDEYLTGRENLHMMGRLYHLSQKDTKRRAEELLKQFDLLDAANRYAKTYSGGMRRRLDLAASLIATPPIIFLDEPTTGLDPRSRLSMWDIIEDLVDGGTTILLTTQHLEEADRLADQIIVIDHGKVIARGSTDELKSRVGRDRIHFTFDDGKTLKKAAKIIDGNHPEIDEKQNKLSVSNDEGVSKLRKYLEKLERSKLPVSAISLSKPTLDDVFMKLTGHKATDQDSKAESLTKRRGQK